MSADASLAMRDPPVTYAKCPHSARAILDYEDMIALSEMFSQWALDGTSFSPERAMELVKWAADYERIADWVGEGWTAPESSESPEKFVATVHRRALRDQAESVARKKLIAEMGSARAQHDLGVMYGRGEDVPQDVVEAEKWTRLAAQQGLAEAQYILGAIYCVGLGVMQDDAEAVRWFRLAAKQGCSSAQHGLGYMYAEGRGVPKDDVAAAGWYRRAAENDHAIAKFSLGLAYLNGDGMPLDYVQAHMWLSIASAQGVEDATAARNTAAADMSADQIAEAQLLEEHWKPISRS